MGGKTYKFATDMCKLRERVTKLEKKVDGLFELNKRILAVINNILELAKAVCNYEESDAKRSA